MSLSKAGFLFLAFGASTCFTYYYFLYTNEYPPGSYERIAQYEADKVFQTRILVTSIANALEPALPVFKITLQWLIPYPINYEVLLQGINVCFLATLVLWIPKFCEALGVSVSPWWGFFCFFPLSWNYILLNGLWDGAGLYYPYDIPSLTFFAIGVTLFLKGKWTMFYALFVIACLNRESTCFITMAGVFLVFQPEPKIGKLILSNRGTIIHLAIQASIWLISRFCLSYIFNDNPGSFFESPHSMHEFVQKMWTGEKHWAMEKPVRFLFLFGGIWIIPILAWKRLLPSTKKLLLVGLVYLVSLYFRSNMMETRVYNELNIILSVVVIIYLNSIFQKKEFKMQFNLFNSK